jgi:hypothetical protein
MVLVVLPNGFAYHGAPHTKEEIEEFYRRTQNGPVAICTAGPRSSPRQRDAEREPQQERTKPTGSAPGAPAVSAVINV